MRSQTARATPEAIDAARTAAAAIEDKKGEDILAFDLSGLLVVTDLFLVASGMSTRHAKTLSQDAEIALRDIGRKPIRREGTEYGEWVLLDYGDLVIHIFDRETRAYYELERLWADAPRVELVSSSTIVEA